MFSVNDNGNNGGSSGGQIPQQMIIDQVEAEVRRRVGAGDSFTALDISRAVQAAGIQERHRHMKVIVHDMYERGDMPGYTRTQVTLPTGEQPFLYHPNNVMIPNRFAVANNQQRTGTTNRTALNTASMFGQGQRPPAPITGRLANGSRLRLPASVLRKAGFLPGDTIYIVRDVATGTLTIRSRPANAPDTRPVKSHQLSSNNLRLTLGRIVAGVAACVRVTISAPGHIDIKAQ